MGISNAPAVRDTTSNPGNDTGSREDVTDVEDEDGNHPTVIGTVSEDLLNKENPTS